MQSTYHFETMPDDELLRRLGVLIAGSRRTEADLVAHMSEAEACLRIAAARGSREHPVLLEMLADGRLHLSAIAKLAPHLTAENRDEILGRATHRTRREIDDLVAELAPRPDAPASIRKLPAGRFVGLPATRRSDVCAAIPDAPGLELRPEGVDSDGFNTLSGGATADTIAAAVCDPRSGTNAGSDTAPHGSAPPCSDPAAPSEAAARADALGSDTDPRSGTAPRWVPARPPGRAAIEPLSPSRYRVQLTASAALRDKLERLQALMRSSIPDGDLAAVIEAAVTEKIERTEARRFGRTGSPRKSISTSDTTPRTRHVPAAVKRAVHERDEGRCRYVDAEGHRCTARVWVQLHHGIPWAAGGDHSPANVSTLCSVHNRYMAEIDFGRGAVGKHRRSSVGSPATQTKLTTG